MKIAKKAVRKSAVARKKVKVAQAMADKPKESTNATPSPEATKTDMLSLANDILKELGEESLLALRDAVEFESDVIQSAVLLKATASLLGRKTPIISADELRKWHMRPKQKIKLHAAIDVVVKNFKGEIPNLEEDIKQGKEIRNQMIHDIGQLIGSAKLGVYFALHEFSYPVNVQCANELVSHSTNSIREMRKEMAKSRQLSLHIFGLTYQKFSSTCKEKIRL